MELTIHVKWRGLRCALRTANQYTTINLGACRTSAPRTTTRLGVQVQRVRLKHG